MAMNDHKVFRVAFCGVMAGLMAAVMLLGTLIPLSTYICPMLAGALAIPVVWELGAGSGWLLYAAVSALKYIGLAVFILLCNTLLLKGLTAFGVAACAAKIMVEVVLFVFNYLIQHSLIFKKEVRTT